MPRCLLVATILVALTARAHAQNADPPLNQLLAQVQQDKHRASAIAQIARLKPNVAVPVLIGLLPTPSEEIRLDAAMALGAIGKPAVGPLQKALAHPDETVRSTPPGACPRGTRREAGGSRALSRRCATRMKMSATRPPTRWGR